MVPFLAKGGLTAFFEIRRSPFTPLVVVVDVVGKFPYVRWPAVWAVDLLDWRSGDLPEVVSG